MVTPYDEKHTPISKACEQDVHFLCTLTCQFCDERCLCLCHWVEVEDGIPTRRRKS